MEWKRITDPILIPRILVEQIKGRNFEVSDFYKTAALATGYVHKGFNENCYLYILLDEPGEIVGFFWAQYDCLTRCLANYYTSILKKYWNCGVGTKLVKRKLLEIMKQRNITRCRALTTRPKALERLGFSRAKRAIVEYDLAPVEA